MLPIEALKSRTTIVTHAGCADGAAAAMIAKAALPHCEVRAFYYDDPEYLSLAATPGILAVDITPPVHRAAEFAAVGTMVCDHHSKDLVTPYGDLGIWGDSKRGESGAWLAYYEVFRPLMGQHSEFCEVAQLSAIYDT